VAGLRRHEGRRLITRRLPHSLALSHESGPGPSLLISRPPRGRTICRSDSVGLAANRARILERKGWMLALGLPRNRAVSWSDLTAARSLARENAAAWAVDGEAKQAPRTKTLG